MTDRPYARPLLLSGPRPDGAAPLAGGALWFREVELLSRGAAPLIVAAADLEAQTLARLTDARAPIAGLAMDSPHLMGILNVTPDSFSDGGVNEGQAAIARGRQMAANGVAILDIGGESTRPGAAYIEPGEEAARVLPALKALSGQAVLSIDTRKAEVARKAIAAGATLFNDVTALTFDADSRAVAAESGVAVCLMHSLADPATMQDDPHYAHVLLDIYDALEQRIEEAVAAGINRARIVVDPGIGFGKTLAHNLALIRGLALFHGLGCPILFGASRKRFIGTIAGVETAAERDPGSHAVMQMALEQGAQILRVHDTDGAHQVLSLWRAITAGDDR